MDHLPHDDFVVLSDLRQQYFQGGMTREVFWQRMEDHHRVLLAYAHLLQTGVIDRILIEATGLGIQLKNGLLFRWDPLDLRSMPNMTMAYGTGEEEVFAFLFRLNRQPRVVLDVGANIGWYALHLLKGVQGGVQIHAFEPIPTTFQTLLHNLAANQATSHILANNCALGADNTQATFYYPDYSGSAAASQQPLYTDQSYRHFDVPVRRMDDYVAQQGLTTVDLIKCDVEGSELFVFQGGRETLARFKPIIYVEMLRKWTRVFHYHPNDTIAFFAGLGYDCWYMDHDHLQPLHEMTEETVQNNFLFLHREQHQAMVARING